MVSKAFQVLSGMRSSSSAFFFFLTHSYDLPDPQKRAAYDRHGSDPEDRSAGMSSGRSSGFATHSFGGGGGGFESEISPEELFNMFFGGGGGGLGGGAFGNAGFGGGGPGLSYQTKHISLFH